MVTTPEGTGCGPVDVAHLRELANITEADHLPQETSALRRSADEIERLRQRHQADEAALRLALPIIEGFAELRGYGSFPGGDPRLFKPDETASTEAERAAWRAACDAWDRGECPENEGSGPGVATFSDPKTGERRTTLGLVEAKVFGLGTITYRDEDAIRARDAIRAALGDGKGTPAATEANPCCSFHGHGGDLRDPCRQWATPQAVLGAPPAPPDAGGLAGWLAGQEPVLAPTRAENAALDETRRRVEEGR
jgi:hypothetical protein